MNRGQSAYSEYFEHSGVAGRGGFALVVVRDDAVGRRRVQAQDTQLLLAVGQLVHFQL